jgi:hypothetical protein
MGTLIVIVRRKSDLLEPRIAGTGIGGWFRESFLLTRELGASNIPRDLGPPIGTTGSIEKMKIRKGEAQ